MTLDKTNGGITGHLLNHDDRRPNTYIIYNIYIHTYIYIYASASSLLTTVAEPLNGNATFNWIHRKYTVRFMIDRKSTELRRAQAVLEQQLSCNEANLEFCQLVA